MKVCNVIIFLSCVFFAISLRATIVGSNLGVSRNNHVNFPENDFLAPNEIRGFALMDGGFTLENSDTECLFNGLFPIRTTMNLNGGDLNLNGDLILENISSLSSLGNILATSIRSFILSSNLETFGSSADTTFYTFENIDMQLKSNIDFQGRLMFEGSNRIIGFGKILSLSSGQLVVNSGAQLILQDIIIDGVEGNNIRCEDDTAQLVLNRVKWIQSDNTYFDTGNLLIQDRVTFLGTNTFTYESREPAVIDSESEWRFSDGILLATGRHPVTESEPFYFQGSSSVLGMDNCSFIINSLGMNLTRGKMNFLRTVSFELNSTNTQTGIVLGDGADADNDFTIEFDPSAVLNNIKGHLTYNNTSPNRFVSKTNTARVNRLEGSYFYMAQNLSISLLTIINQSLLVPPVTVNTGKTLTFEDTLLGNKNFQFDIKGTYYSPVVNLLTNNDRIALIKGTLLLGTFIQSTGNTLGGNGTFGGPIIFLSPLATANWDLNGTLNSSFTFNGATLSLLRNLTLDSSGSLVGPGTLNLLGATIYFSPIESTCTTPMTFNGNGRLFLRNKLTLENSWTFNNDVLIEGSGQVLSLGATGALIVNPGASLTLKNVYLENVSGTNIRCVDDTGVILFDSANCTQSDNYVFEYGALRFKNNCKWAGKNCIFSYQTVLTSTILSDASLILDQDFTFSYAPSVAVGGDNLIEFANVSSKLILDGATLVATNTGWQLTDGTLKINSNSIVGAVSFTDDNGNFIDKGITFGNRDSEHDLTVIVEPGVTLNCNQGTLNYKNINISSLRFQKNSSAFKFLTGTRFRVFETINVDPGSVIFENQTTLQLVFGKQYIGSIIPLGQLARFFFTSI